MPVWVVNLSISGLHLVSPELSSAADPDGLDSVPRTAVAAATSGETRCVRPPLPCRPSKLRFEVDAQRSPGASWSGFMPRHIEQPAKRHSAPKSMNDLVEALGLGLEPHARGARDDHDAHAVGLLPALDDRRERAQVFDAAVRARAHEDGVDRDILQRRAGLQVHVLEGALGGGALVGVGEVGRVEGTTSRERDALAGVRAPGDERLERVRVEEHLGVVDRALVGGRVLPVGDGVVPVLALRRVRRGP